MPSGIPRTPEPWEWMQTRSCTGCGEVKPWARFSPRTYWPDGTVRTIQSHCHTCQAKTVHARQAAWRDRHRQRRRRYQRDWLRRKRAAIRAERGGIGKRLPVAPFIAWLRQVELEEGDLASLARAANLHTDSLTHALKRHRYVSLTVADAALTARGCHLHDLWPELLEAA